MIGVIGKQQAFQRRRKKNTIGKHQLKCSL